MFMVITSYSDSDYIRNLKWKMTKLLMKKMMIMKITFFKNFSCINTQPVTKKFLAYASLSID